jgi:hypothetical protein
MNVGSQKVSPRHGPFRGAEAPEGEEHQHAADRERLEHVPPPERPDEGRPERAEQDVGREAARHVDTHRRRSQARRKQRHDEQETRRKHQSPEEPRRDLIRQHQPVVVELGEAERKKVRSEQPDREQLTRADSVREVSRRDLHHRVHEGGRRAERPRLGKAQVGVGPDQRQEQADPAEHQRLHALAEDDERDAQDPGSRTTRRRRYGRIRVHLGVVVQPSSSKC